MVHSSLKVLSWCAQRCLRFRLERPDIPRLDEAALVMREGVGEIKVDSARQPAPAVSVTILGISAFAVYVEAAGHNFWFSPWTC